MDWQLRIWAVPYDTGWWFGTFFPYLGNNNPNWLSFFSEGLKPPSRIIHSGKYASSGHYYALGRRSEPTPGGDCGWYTMDDSEIKEPEVSLLTGNPPEELLNDSAYVVFLRCKQAPPTGEIRIPLSLVEYVKKQDKKKWVEPNRVCWLGVSQPPFSFIFGKAPCTSHSLDLSIHLTYPTAKSVSSEVSGTASKSMGKVSLS